MSLAVRETQGTPVRRATQWRQVRQFLSGMVITAVVLLLVTTYLRPLYFSINSSLGPAATEFDQPQYPSSIKNFTFNGLPLEMYSVPTPVGVRQLALIEKGQASSVFIDPATKQRVTWQGSWRSLKRVYFFDPKWSNYSEAAKGLDFLHFFRNTLIVAVLATIGSVASGVMVAYGLARYSLPQTPFLMGILQTTLIVPREVLIVPTYIIFYKLGWVGTWLPLIVPLFFGNSFAIFLLRQFFLAIPRELDEAAMLDGANPFQILTRIIVPLVIPGIISVAVFQFIFSWNDVFSPVLYLAGHDDLQLISPALNRFSSSYGTSNPQLTAAAGLLASLLPVGLFLLAQRPYFRAMMMPGLDK